MAKLVIFGTGDISRLAHYYFTNDSDHQVTAFTVDRAYRDSNEFLNLPLVDFEEVTKLYPPGDFFMFIAVSYTQLNKIRAEKYFQAKKWGYKLESYISSRCSFLTEYPTGDNCFILEDNTIQPFVKIGNNVTLWSGNHIGHDSIIEDHCFLASHIVVSGHCRISEYCFLGVNATLRNSITIAPKTVIGAGAIIMKDTKEGGVYVPQRSKLYTKTSDEIEL
jgi:sugar O-acyltransferase (sialic acid O-acetyltransferase NeuD family)